jgi:hypothetical protein
MGVNQSNGHDMVTMGTDLSILPISTIFLLGFETVPTMWYFCCCSFYY